MEPSFADPAVRRPEARRIVGLVRADLLPAQTRTLLDGLPRAGAAEPLREHFPYEEQEA